MYQIINLKTETEKMKVILGEMVKIKNRKLDFAELETIYLEMTRIINETKYYSDLFEDISKTLFIVNHYYQIKNSTQILLESLHLCKMNAMENKNVKNTINSCIDMIGNFMVDKALIQAITNVLLITNRYLTIVDSENLTEELFWNFIKTSIHCEAFSNSAFCMSIKIYFDEYSDCIDKHLEDLFEDLMILLEDESVFLNYSDFIKWYLRNHCEIN